jgi:asparagine synthetase B (glutamine-hydrolysing)
MCGIGVTIFPQISNPNPNDSNPQQNALFSKAIQKCLQRRGPDHQSIQSNILSTHNNHQEQQLTLELTLYASVLHMRGYKLLPQPYCTPGYSFCWNGECYAHDHPAAASILVSPPFDVAEEKYEEITSDTVKVMELIQHELLSMEDEKQQEQALANALSHVQGEYSFIFYNHGPQQQGRDHNQGLDQQSSLPLQSSEENDAVEHGNACIYFGRDPLGRRSLLMSYTETNPPQRLKVQEHSHGTDRSDDNITIALDASFVISSVAPYQQTTSEGKINTGTGFKPFLNMEEIPAGRVYRLDLCTGQLSFVPIIPSTAIGHPSSMNLPLLPNSSWNTLFNKDVSPHLLQAAQKLHHCLNQAVRRRVIHAPVPLSMNTGGSTSIPTNNQATVAVLFSGGVDSVVLAALSHEHVPIDQPIDLINVAFASSTSSQHQHQEDPYSSSPDRQAALLSYEEMIHKFPTRKWRFIAVNVDYAEVLREEAGICQLLHPLSSTMDFNIGTAFWFATRGYGEVVSILGDDGGGMNGRQEHLRFAAVGTESGAGDCATIRVQEEKILRCGTTGCQRKAREECTFHVCNVCCSSTFHRRINQFLGGRADLCPFHNHHRSSKKNKNETKKNKKEHRVNAKADKNHRTFPQTKKKGMMYTSRARVVLVGIGADEQMAGYGRHRVTYERGGYEALRLELKMEKSRLWTRNLGRDDRCISHHGKEARFPFLDENVVGYLNSLDVTDLCDMSKPQGLGDKMILRLVAKHIGVTQCSGLVKRAIQFGSRIAKCSDVDRFGSSRKASGTAKHTPKESTNIKNKQ